MQRGLFGLFCAAVLVLCAGFVSAASLSYPIVDTGQQACYDNDGPIPCPEPGERFYGQDAQYLGNAPKYTDNGDGTVTDEVTGLMWVKARGEALLWEAHMAAAKDCRVGEYDDWRAPTIKELYSLIDFRGNSGPTEAETTTYLDTRYFDYAFGDTSKGLRLIDCQDYSATVYTGTTMKDSPTVFGVNFVDGRIKGYPMTDKDGVGRYMRYVRENPDYGSNSFSRKDDVVVDAATGLNWQQAAPGTTYNWEAATAYCQDLSLGGRDDWRLPNAKELQSLVDYSRSPSKTGSAAIDPVFSVSETESYFWSSTTHLEGRSPGMFAAYVAFGRALGYMGPDSSKRLMDVHGAGAQRSDPKAGDPAEYPQGHGPQGDDIRIYNHVRCVAGGATPHTPAADATDTPPWAGLKASTATDTPPPTLQNIEGRSGAMQSPEGSSPGQGTPHRPPQAAIDACNDKTPGESCNFSAPGRKVQGTCRAVPGGTACVPGD